MENQQNPMAQPPLEPLARQKHLPPQPSPRLRLAGKIWVPVLVVVVLIVAYLGIASAYNIWPFTHVSPPAKDEIGGDDLSAEALAKEEEGVNELASWQTYRNQEFGFEVRYPGEWKIADTIGHPNRIYFAMLADDQAYIDYYVFNKNTKFPKRGFRAYISVSKNIVPAGTDTESALELEEGRGAPRLVDKKYLTINGIPALRSKWLLEPGDILSAGDKYDGILSTGIEYNFLRGSDLYRMWGTFENENPDEKIKLFDQAANTFKFIN